MNHQPVPHMSDSILIAGHNLVLFIITLANVQNVIMWILQITLLIVSIRFYLLKIKSEKKNIDNDTKPLDK